MKPFSTPRGVNSPREDVNALKMKDLAELAIQFLYSYENFDVLGPINAFENLAKTNILLNYLFFQKFLSFCIHVSPGSVDESPGSAEWSWGDLIF